MATAKAGDKLTAKALKRLERVLSERVFKGMFRTEEDHVVKPKAQGVGGQWLCIDCGEGAHSRSSWTG